MQIASILQSFLLEIPVLLIKLEQMQNKMLTHHKAGAIFPNLLRNAASVR